MTVVIASDHAGTELKEFLKGRISVHGHQVVDMGTNDGSSVDYPDFASLVAKAVSSGKFDIGVLICGTGIGMSIAANKIPGIRAALCTNEFMAAMARKHNNANVIALGARILDRETAGKILDIFMSTEFEGGRHATRLEKITRMEG